MKMVNHTVGAIKAASALGESVVEVYVEAGGNVAATARIVKKERSQRRCCWAVVCELSADPLLITKMWVSNPNRRFRYIPYIQ